MIYMPANELVFSVGWVYSLLIFSAAVLRVLGHEAEAIPLSLALIIGWCNSIYFARGFKMLGQFSIMIQKVRCLNVLNGNRAAYN